MPVNNFATGSKNDVGTTRSQIGSTSEVAKKGIQVVADPNNTVVVYIGDDTVTAGTSAATTDGYPLQAGDTVVIPIFHASEVYAITSSSTATIHFMLI
tara:strand:+ start:5643 stop:5936 length:294 start_codon:yes stop_codon:yes gene_type:complete